MKAWPRGLAQGLEPFVLISPSENQRGKVSLVSLTDPGGGGLSGFGNSTVSIPRPGRKALESNVIQSRLKFNYH